MKVDLKASCSELTTKVFQILFILFLIFVFLQDKQQDNSAETQDCDEKY